MIEFKFTDPAWTHFHWSNADPVRVFAVKHGRKQFRWELHRSGTARLRSQDSFKNPDKAAQDFFRFLIEFYQAGLKSFDQ